MKASRHINYFLLSAGFVIFASCGNRPGPYENSLGIAPSQVAALDSVHYTRISWTDTLVDFGTISEGKMVKVSFEFHNTGETPLLISEVSPSCGCTVADYPREAIMPGKAGRITAGFDSHDHPGFIKKSITVISNTRPRTRQLLFFSGQVITGQIERSGNNRAPGAIKN
jgi:hypothetical protein